MKFTRIITNHLESYVSRHFTWKCKEKRTIAFSTGDLFEFEVRNSDNHTSVSIRRGEKWKSIKVTIWCESTALYSCELKTYKDVSDFKKQIRSRFANF